MRALTVGRHVPPELARTVRQPASTRIDPHNMETTLRTQRPKLVHRAMLFYASGVATNADALHAGGHGLIHAQELLDMAMQRFHELFTPLPAILCFRRSYGRPITARSAYRRAAVTVNLQHLHGFSPSPQHAQVHKLS
ncbi:hypothetical protein D1007_41829 [Hordeum vulgare]|nr:hypothetical protein D1007_41829 [Hordeum vulgare]